MSTDKPETLDAADGSSDRKPRLRFPKAVRLFRAAEFARVKIEGRSVHGKFMLLGVLKGQRENGARVGIVTSRRVGGAVQRNRVRRRLREIVRLARPSMITGVWMVIIAKSAATNVAHAELQAEWTQLARKAGCLED